jgi:hypothetical protein
MSELQPYDGRDAWTTTKTHWWKRFRLGDWLLLLPALIILPFQVLFPWFRQFGIAKFCVVFMVIWTIYGFFATTFDSGPQNWHQTVHSCDAGDAFTMGGLPFGKTYLLGVGCTGKVTAGMCRTLGISPCAKGIDHWTRTTILDYMTASGFTSVYLGLGLVFLAGVFALTLWIPLALVWAVISHLRWS